MINFRSMGILLNVASPFLNFLKKLAHSVEFRKFKDAVRRNPQDHHLRARFAKYCLNHYFKDSPSQIHVVEAVNQFENIVHSEVLDLEVFYLMGKYYQGKDDKKAREVYQTGIKRYNEFVAKSVEFRHTYVETGFMIALNLLALEANKADPELVQFFKNIRRTYLKQFLDNRLETGLEAKGIPGEEKVAG